jgi:hypothetical protein
LLTILSRRCCRYLRNRIRIRIEEHHLHHSDSGIVASSCVVVHLCGGIRLSKHHVLKTLWSPLLVVPDLLLCKNTQLAWCADA